MDLKIKKQSGQILLESLLLLVLMMGFTFTLIKALQKADFVGSLTFKPWAKVTGMIECGVWQECGINTSSNKGQHPGNFPLTLDPTGRGG
jgi:hypothetical protein